MQQYLVHLYSRWSLSQFTQSWRPPSGSPLSMKASSLDSTATVSSTWSLSSYPLSVFRVTSSGNSKPHSFPSDITANRLHSYARTYRPESYHIAQELQKYNIPDYRPRQEQYVGPCLPQQIVLTPLFRRFQKAIKKVRAVQRMRRNRGFAFSQTETAGGQDQARLIRAYDTSKSDARPSGY